MQNLFKTVYLKDRDTKRNKAETWWDKHGLNADGTEELSVLYKVPKIFSHSKPSVTLKHLVNISTLIDSSDIILDFFSGSATTAHAVMQLNAEELQKELTTKDTKSTKKEGVEKEPLSSISSVSWLKNLDIGFRVYKTDTTNMKDVFYHPSELKQHLLPGLESNIKEDSTAEDLLAQVILDLGLELTLPIETKQFLGNTVFIVQTNALVACFDKDIDFKIVDTISDLKPLKVVFKDASFQDDKDRINVEERFKRLSPETKITVI